MKSKTPFDSIFTSSILVSLMPADTADRFFDALFGDPREGAYDIFLSYRGVEGRHLLFDIELRQRPGKCLACNLTYGLPQVFSRHPVINVKGLVKRICELLGGEVKCGDWALGATQEISRQLHIIPLRISIAGKSPARDIQGELEA